MPARVLRAASPVDLAGGTHASGRIGDWVLANEHTRAVITDIPNAGGFALTGGQLVDLAGADLHDELGLVFTYLGRFPRQLAYRTLRVERRNDGSAAIVVEGVEPRTHGLEGTTEYVLAPGQRGLTLRTTLTNRAQTSTSLGLGDAIQWAAADHWAPVRGFALRGEWRGPFIAGVGRRVAYAYASGTELFGPHGGSWSDPMQARITLLPGQSVTYERRIGISRGGDVSGALAATGLVHETGTLRLRAVAARTDQPIGGVRAVLHDLDGHALRMGSTDADGNVEVSAPPGDYLIGAFAPGRTLVSWTQLHADASPHAPGAVGIDLAGADAGPRLVPIADVPDASGDAGIATNAPVAPIASLHRVSIRPNASVRVRLGEPSSVRLSITARDADSASPRAVASRVLIHGVEPTSEPNFGPVGFADGARNTVIVPASGNADVALAPGRYRIVATHGIAYALAESTVEVHEGRSVSVRLELRRALDTTGYVCGDFHTHQAPSLDSPVSLRDRVRAAAAEALDVIASTDHNVVSDLSAAAREEGVQDAMLTIAGDEVTSDIAVRPAGHWNVFPLVHDPNAPGGGAPDLLERSVAQIISEVRSRWPGAVLQVNHPRSGSPTGAFDVVGFDPATARAREEFRPDFDTIEVWNGRFQPQVETVLADWLALLRAGARIAATANSDSHSIAVQEVGFPRTCLRVPDSNAGRFTQDHVVRALKETRDVILTDGPFLRVIAPDGQSAIGRSLRPDRLGRLVLRVQVSAPLWAEPDVLEVIHADGRIEPLTVTFSRDASSVRAETSVDVRAETPFVLFRARGSRAIETLVDDPPMLPMAISNPVWIERSTRGARAPAGRR